MPKKEKKPRDRKESERHTLRYKRLIREASKLAYKYESLNPKHWGAVEITNLCQKIYKSTNPITRSRMFNLLTKDEIAKNDVVEAYLKKLDDYGLTEDKELEVAKKGIELIKTTSDALNVARYIADKRGTTKGKPNTQINTQFNFNDVIKQTQTISQKDDIDVFIPQETDIQKD